MPLQIKRRSDNIKILEAGFLIDKPIHDMRCRNCKERHYLVQIISDRNNFLCTHCGALTPIRSLAHSRGLAAPAIQNQQTAITQPKGVQMGKDRLPKGIHDGRKNLLTQALESKAFQVTDSQYVEPQP